MENRNLIDPIETTSNNQILPDKRQHRSSDNVTSKYISKNKLHKPSKKKPKVDRTYTKRKRYSKKNLHYIRFAKDELAWAMWIERDGLENTKVKTRSIVRSDLTRSSKDFRDSNEVISAFLMVVLKDTTLSSKKTSVVSIDNHVSNLYQRCAYPYDKTCKASRLSNMYLHRYSNYDPDIVLKAVYASIERLMKRADYQKYYSGLLNQKELAQRILLSKEQYCTVDTANVKGNLAEEQNANSGIDDSNRLCSEKKCESNNDR